MRTSLSFSFDAQKCGPISHRRTQSNTVLYQGSYDKARCLLRSYADKTKPRPLLRGVVHGVVSVALAYGILWMRTRSLLLTVAFLCKLCTYACSATFHLYPRGLWSMADETRAFIADIIAVPLSVSGTILPFAGGANGEAVLREGLLALVVLLANVACVIWQCWGQVGLKTPTDRSDTPRTLCICAYSLWSIGMSGVATGFCGAWVGMAGLGIVAVCFADRVAKAHELEPTAPWAIWHTPGVNSFHEDFHLALLGSDLCWLRLALATLGQ